MQVLGDKYKVPYPVRDSFSEGYASEFSRTRMDDGQFRLTRTVDSQPMKNTLTWELSWEQLSMFEGWIEYELNGGANWFDMQVGPLAPTFRYLFINAPEFNFDEDRNLWVVTVEVKRIIAGPAIKPLSYFPDWPSTLPEPEKSGYSFSVPDHIAFGNIQGGDAGNRRRFTDKLTQYNARWILDAVQYAAFLDFMSEDLAAGIAYFRAPFANGMGYNLVKARFIIAPIAKPLGTHWVVTSRLETTSAPIISQIMFELGGKLRFEDIISLSENVQILKTGEGFVNDTIVLTDYMARVLRDSDSFGVIDQIAIKTGRPISESLSLSDSILYTLQRGYIEQLVLEDELTWAYTKSQADTVNLIEEVASTTSFKRQTTPDEIILVEDDLTFEIQYGRGLVDYIDLGDAGQACYQNYAEASYFAENYVYTCFAWGNNLDTVTLQEELVFRYPKSLSDNIGFSSETLVFKYVKSISETVTLNETIDNLLSVTREPEDNVSLQEVGNVGKQDYAEPSYFTSTDYARTYTPFIS